MVTPIPIPVKMSYNTTMKPTLKPTTAMILWVARNHGALTEIAVKADVSPQFVHMVLRGNRSNSRVEQLLRERGAPMADREAETMPV